MTRLRTLTALIVSFVLVLVLATACSGGGKDGSSDTGTKGSDTTQQSKGTETQNKSPIVMKLGHNSSPDSIKHQAAERWAAALDKGTDGQVKMEVYPAAQLGTDVQGVEGVKLGTIDGWIVGTAILFSHEKRLALTELPYLFENSQAATNFYLKAPIVQELTDELVKKGIRILSWGELGYRQLTNSVRPVSKPEDVKGLRLRVPEIEVYSRLWKMMGASTTPMDFSEIYLALQQGTVDGQDNPIELTYSNKFQEVQKYLSLTRHMYNAYPFMISEKAWQKLTPDQQKVLRDAAIDAAAWQVKATDDQEQDMIRGMQDKGVKVNEVDMNAFKQAMRPVYDELGKSLGQDLMTRVLKEAEEYSK